MTKTEEKAERLMNFLQKNKGDRGLMADLRCGFSHANRFPLSEEYYRVLFTAWSQ